MLPETDRRKYVGMLGEEICRYGVNSRVVSHERSCPFCYCTWRETSPARALGRRCKAAVRGGPQRPGIRPAGICARTTWTTADALLVIKRCCVPESLSRADPSRVMSTMSQRLDRSRSMRRFLVSRPPPNPVSEPSLPTHRWHGTMIGMGFFPMAPPTALAAFGLPMASAIAL